MISRLHQFLDYQGISVRRFEQLISASNGMIRKAITNNTDIQSKWIAKIIEIFPDLSVEWLLTGKGSMLKSIDITESQQAKPTEATYSFEAEYYKRQLAEKEDEIAALNQEIGRLKAIIENSKSNT